MMTMTNIDDIYDDNHDNGNDDKNDDDDNGDDDDGYDDWREIYFNMQKKKRSVDTFVSR